MLKEVNRILGMEKDKVAVPCPNCHSMVEFRCFHGVKVPSDIYAKMLVIPMHKNDSYSAVCSLCKKKVQARIENENLILTILV